MHPYGQNTHTHIWPRCSISPLRATEVSLYEWLPDHAGTVGMATVKEKAGMDQQ